MADSANTFSSTNASDAAGETPTWVVLKHAEAAFADGRLEEAAATVTAPARQHRRGQKLVTRLIDALLNRADDHLAHAREPAALRDAQLAQKLGGSQPRVLDVMQRASDALIARQQAAAQKQQRVRDAAAHAHRGKYTLAEAALGASSASSASSSELDASAIALKQRIDAGRNTRDDARRAIHAAAASGDAEAILRQLHAMPTLADDPAVADAIAQAGRRLVDRAADALTAGDLDAFVARSNIIEAWLDAAAHTEAAAALLADRDRVLTVHRAVADRQYRTARETVAILRNRHPKAAWLAALDTQLAAAAEADDALQRSPLAALTNRAPRRPMARSRVAPPAEPSQENGATPNAFWLDVAGVGGFRVVRQPRVRVGPARRDATPDVPLQLDEGPTVALARDETDWLLTAPTALPINGSPAARKLLRDGDRIALTSRCRLRFQQANPASATAMLNVEGARLAGTDVRRVILLADVLILGAGGDAHLRPPGEARVTLRATRDGLHARGGRVRVDGRDWPADTALPMDRRILIDDVELRLRSK